MPVYGQAREASGRSSTHVRSTPPSPRQRRARATRDRSRRSAYRRCRRASAAQSNRGVIISDPAGGSWRTTLPAMRSSNAGRRDLEADAMVARRGTEMHAAPEAVTENGNPAFARRTARHQRWSMLKLEGSKSSTSVLRSGSCRGSDSPLDSCTSGWPLTTNSDLVAGSRQ